MAAILRSALGKGREFDLIRRFMGAAGTSSPGVLVGPGDDCAIVAGERLALTIDLSVEDIHFRRDWMTPEEIGARAAAAALSDLAAVAAKPIGLLVAIAFPVADARSYAARVIDGVRSVANDQGAMLLGGDVSRSLGSLGLDIAAIGSVEKPALRSGAQPGDSLWVTGRLGGAAAAVAAWLEDREPSAEARAAFVRPVPRWREAGWLAERGALHALIDLSDGLAGDAGHIAAASNVRIVLEASSIPVHDAARVHSPDRPLDLALHGGEDYELLLAAPAGVVERIVAEFERAFDLPLTRVGDVVEGEDVVLRTPDGEQELAGGFDHFTRTAS
jgi:thiamine-monophosphate kinase